METRDGIFAGENPFQLARDWLAEAEETEVNDPNAIALASVDANGSPNVRIVLLKDIEDDAFVFYTNFESAKGRELSQSGQAAFVLHWKSLRRQIRVRGTVARVEGDIADKYYQSRPRQSQIGAWASQQSRPLMSREALMAKVAEISEKTDGAPDRPPFWGGFRITPSEMEFWAEGSFRLHDRFHWVKEDDNNGWTVTRLNP